MHQYCGGDVLERRARAVEHHHLAGPCLPGRRPLTAHPADADRIVQGSAIVDALYAQMGGATR